MCIRKLITDFVQIVLVLQPYAFGVSFNLNFQLVSQSCWSLFNETWRNRPGERDERLRFENEEMTFRMQWAAAYNLTELGAVFRHDEFHQIDSQVSQRRLISTICLSV